VAGIPNRNSWCENFSIVWGIGSGYKTRIFLGNQTLSFTQEKQLFSFMDVFGIGTTVDWHTRQKPESGSGRASLPETSSGIKRTWQR
jgi:hypothetical protein